MVRNTGRLQVMARVRQSTGAPAYHAGPRCRGNFPVRFQPQIEN